MKKIYAKKYNCSLEPWSLSRGIEPDFIDDSNLGEDNYKMDRDELTEKFEKKYFKNGVETLIGDTDSRIDNTLSIMNDNNNIVLKGGYLEKRNHYIRVPYLIKDGNKITILFLQFKGLEKFFKDWGTKASFMPNLSYTMDMAEYNLGNEFELEYKLVTLEEPENDFQEIIIYNNRNGNENIFAKECEKNHPVYHDLTSDEQPDTIIGRECKKCPYRKSHGIPDISILELEVTSQCWRTTKKIIDKIKSFKIEDMGKEEIDMLSDVQRNKLNAIQSPDGLSMNMDIINEFLDKIENGYASFDFETYSSILPPLDKYANYAQIPFSYSLDIVDGWGDITHTDYIVPYDSKDFDSLYIHLKENLPTDTPIVVYFKTFEISRFKEFQELYPDDYDLIQSWIDNIIDLYEVFSTGGYYDLRFNDSCSLKNVYPVLVDSKAYEYLNINNGEVAMMKYKLLFNNKISVNEDKDSILNDLIKYNAQDTMAQIEIINFLQKLG